jgi:hypothetical protein
MAIAVATEHAASASGAEESREFIRDARKATVPKTSSTQNNAVATGALRGRGSAGKSWWMMFTILGSNYG